MANYYIRQTRMHTIQERCAVSRKLCNTVWFCLHSITLQLLFTCTIKAQYTPPTQLNSPVESRRRCVLGSIYIPSKTLISYLGHERKHNTIPHVICPTPISAKKLGVPYKWSRCMMLGSTKSEHHSQTNCKIIFQRSNLWSRYLHVTDGRTDNLPYQPVLVW